MTEGAEGIMFLINQEGLCSSVLKHSRFIAYMWHFPYALLFLKRFIYEGNIYILKGFPLRYLFLKGFLLKIFVPEGIHSFLSD